MPEILRVEEVNSAQMLIARKLQSRFAETGA
jgi:hypothetical protein